MDSIGKAAVAEFVATFTLVAAVAGSVILNVNGQLDLTGVALAHGLALTVVISITAHISGGLVNPAVAISLWVTGRLSTSRAGVSIAAELAGAAAAAALLRVLLPAELFAGTPRAVLTPATVGSRPSVTASRPARAS